VAEGHLPWSGLDTVVKEPPVATAVATRSVFDNPTDSPRSALTSTYVVETMGLEPTTSCLQSVGLTVQERPQASPRDDLAAHALPHTAPVATAVATEIGRYALPWPGLRHAITSHWLAKRPEVGSPPSVDRPQGTHRYGPAT
jgi:hypothetical protein